VKLRDRLIALLCILAFAGIGVLLFKKWVVQRPFAVILIVSDNLEPRSLAAARLYGARQDGLAMDTLGDQRLLANHAADSPVANNSAAAALISGGEAVPWNRTPPANAKLLIDQARASGRSIGLVTNRFVTRKAPATFITKEANADDGPAIAERLLEANKFDVILGGGLGDFLPPLKEGFREDARDLLLEARQAGYASVRNLAELEAFPTWQAPRLLGLFAKGAMAYRNANGPAAYQPSLSTMARKAVQLLEYDADGYLLIVDAGLVHEAALARKPEAMLDELLELDRTIQVARRYAGRKSLVAVAGLSNTGGLALSGKPFPGEHGAAFAGNNRSGTPFLQWNTFPQSPYLAGDQLFFFKAWESPLPTGTASRVKGETLHRWLLDQL